DEGGRPHVSIVAGLDLAGARRDLAPPGCTKAATRKVMAMILSAYHFQGDPDPLMESHRRMMELFPASGLDLHLAVTRDDGMTIYDSCPDLATHEAFVVSPEFRGALAQVGLPDPTIEVLGEVHFAHLNQSVLR